MVGGGLMGGWMVVVILFGCVKKGCGMGERWEDIGMRGYGGWRGLGYGGEGGMDGRGM